MWKLKAQLISLSSTELQRTEPGPHSWGSAICRDPGVSDVDGLNETYEFELELKYSLIKGISANADPH